MATPSRSLDSDGNHHPRDDLHHCAMWLTALAIRRPVVIWTAMIAVAILGLVAYYRLPTELNPRASVPTITVVTVYPGAPPREVEAQITERIEEAVGTAGGVRHVYSSSQDSVSIVSLDFVVGTDVDKSLAQVRERVDTVRPALPAEAMPPTVAKLDINAQPVLYASLTSAAGSRAVRAAVEKVLKPRILRIEGVAAVTVSGGEAREVRVLADPQRMANAGVTVQDVVNAISGAHRNIPAGELRDASTQVGVRTAAEFHAPEEIAQAQILNLQLMANSFIPDIPVPGLPARSKSSGPLLVGDVADVVVAPARGTVLTRADGQPSVSLIVAKAPDANAIAVAEEARLILESARRSTLPPGTEVVIGRDEARFVRDALHDVNLTLVLGALLATIVVLVFLRDLRGTVIIALALPSSILATYIVMHFAGFTLNQMTLLALSLSVGILVDDSIVVLESITRHRRLGEAPVEAAFNGRTEIGFASIALTLTDVVVFLPIAFMGGIVGAFFREFGLTVAAATLFSLVVSFTITPTLAAHWHGRRTLTAHREDHSAWALDTYRRVLRYMLERRWWAIGWSAVLLAAVVLTTIPVLGFEFLPASDQGQLAVTVETPPGTSLARTDAVTRRVEQQIAADPDVEHYLTTVGEIVAGFGAIPQRGSQYAQVSVRLRERARTEHYLWGFGRAARGLRVRRDQDVAADLRRAFAGVTDARIRVAPIRTVANVGPDVQIELRSRDLESLTQAATVVRNSIAKLPQVLDADMSLRTAQQELQVEFDRTLAAAADIPPAQAGSILRDAMAGADVGYLHLEDENVPVRVNVAEEYLHSQDLLAMVPIGYSHQRAVLVGDVARLVRRPSPASVTRLDGDRLATVTAGLAPGSALGTVRASIEEAVRGKLPKGVEMTFGGESGVMEENVPHFVLALTLAVVLVYLVMAALFNSMLYPLIIMLTLPMALIGGLAALALTGETLSLVSGIGVIMLVGLMGRNAILLVDYANTLRARGLSPAEAAVEAGATRLRPILMTTLATLFGMLPVALRIGTASELRAPMAIVVIGGLLVSSVLTLIVIPCAYTIATGAPGGTFIGHDTRPSRRDGRRGSGRAAH